MPSPDVVASALLLPTFLLSLALSVHNWRVHRSTPLKDVLLALLAILAAVAGGTALSAACGQPLKVVARVFTILLQTTLSSVSVYALSPSSQNPAFPPPFLGFFLSLASLLVGCELISTLIPTSPLLLPAMLALVSRGILLTLAIATAIQLRRRHAAISAGINIEKGWPANESSRKTPGRVSSPTQATWPFPGSLAFQGHPKLGSCPANKSPQHDLPSSTFTRTHNIDEHAYKADRQNFIFLPMVLTIAQIFATLSAALNVAASILVEGAIIRTNQPLPHILLASATCTLLWSFMVLATIQSKSSSFISILSSHTWHVVKYFLLHLDRIHRRSKLQ
ncbi:hypothetical protein HD554DRAFT_253888 [Boletus coccyginus]|nr:hypothetical protein HD554DRAFT_253888 [Boletus coccyginus]